MLFIDPFSMSNPSTYLEILDAVVDAGRKDLVLPTAPRLSDYLDDLLQGTAHPVEHGVFVDPGRLAIWVPQASLGKGLESEMSKLLTSSTPFNSYPVLSLPRPFGHSLSFMITWLELEE